MRGRATKKFLHDYSVAIVTTILLIILLAILLLIRFGTLASVKDLSKINPLITSGQNKLVAANDSNEIIKVPMDDDAKTTGQTDKPTGSGGASTTKPSTGSGTTGNGSSGSGSGSTNQPPDKPVFAATIGQMRHFASSGTSLLGVCTITHQFQADIAAQNAPGTVAYNWKQSNGTTGQTQQAVFQAGDTTKTVSYSWTISAASGNYSVTIFLTSPTKQQQTLIFQHTCSVVGL